MSISTERFLKEWVYPPVHTLEITCHESSSCVGKGVVSIVVPPSPTEGKPYVVTRTVDASGKVRGTLFGYYERVQDTIPATSAESIRAHLRDGMRFAEITRRLDTIEAFLGNSSSGVTPEHQSNSEADLRERISQAENALERKDRPNIVLAVTSTTPCTFPELFKSQSGSLVQLLESPPLLRQDGFAITLKNRFKPAEIVQGRLRRVNARGNRLLELWKDGVLIAIGPGDDDLLCWAARRQTPTPIPGLPVRNFVLSEVTLNFLTLAVEVFRHAAPSPRALKFSLFLKNMTEEGVLCTLSSAPDNRPVFEWGGGTRTAPGADITSTSVASFDSIDQGKVAYSLLGELYVQFGFNYDDMPYIERNTDANRITPKSLFGDAWK
jgi:hypothetical protein